MPFLPFVTALVITFVGVIPVYGAGIQTLTVDHKDQAELELTVYNNFALVRDSRNLVLPEGKLYLEFKEVAQTIEPSSVSVTTSSGDIDVLEQSYRYDLLNRQSLLETYIGRKLKYSRTVLQGQTYEKVLREGILLSTNPEIVDFGDEIEISPEGVISLPDVPEGLTLNPTLVWKLDSERTGERELITRYIANQIQWRADYVLSLDEDEGTLDLSSWATVRNDSGTIFENTKIRLVAGNVNKVAAQMQPKAVYAMSDMRMASSEAAGIVMEETGAYQAFDLPHRTTIMNHEAKQLKFIEARDVKFEQTYKLRNQVATYQRGGFETPAVSVELSFANTRKNGLGLALAQGVARAYNGAHDSADLLGETHLTATPAGQDVSLQLGRAFDLTAQRTQKGFVRLSDRSFELEYAIELSNARAKPAVVLVKEMMQGDWQIMESSEPMKRVGRSAEAEVTVPGKGSVTLTYRVRIRV